MKTVEQMIATVQIYIHHRKNKQVQINRPTNTKQFLLLTRAYAIAQDWLEANLK